MIYFTLLLVLLVGGTLTVITIQNLDTLVPLSIFSWQAPSLSLGVLIIVAFVLGALLLYVISFVSAWHDMRELRRMRQRITELERSVREMVPAVPPAGIAAVPMPGMPNPETPQQPQG
jgi:uncharacterized integral membrane protein